MPSISLLQRQINKIVEYLAAQGKNIINDAIRTKTTRYRTKNQNDAYGWAVYYNGKEMQRGYLTATPQATQKRNGWKRAGIERGFGRSDVIDFLNSYAPKGNGFQLIVVNAVFYTKILERGGGGVKSRYRVISQEFSNMAKVGRLIARNFTVTTL